MTRRTRLVALTAASRAIGTCPEVRAITARAHEVGAPIRSTPTVSLTVPGMRPRQVTADLARHGVCAWDGDHYAGELFDAIGVNDSGGAVRLGLMHYNTVEEVHRLLDAVALLARPR